MLLSQDDFASASCLLEGDVLGETKMGAGNSGTTIMSLFNDISGQVGLYESFVL